MYAKYLVKFLVKRELAIKINNVVFYNAGRRSYFYFIVSEEKIWDSRY